MLDYASVAAIHAVVRTGSFEKAARQLGLTPSAVSQRVRLIEERLGAVLIVRGQPAAATTLGTKLCQHFEQVMLLESGLSEDLPNGIAAETPVTLRLAVTADSLATWFVPAMAAVDNVLFDLVVDDQDHSADWLRRGEVAAALSGHGAPVQGCDSVRLGALRYVATASPVFVERWFAQGLGESAFRLAPALTFNRKDRLQRLWLESLLGHEVAGPTHWLPSSQAFVDAALAGMGWGMNPQALVDEHIAAGRLVALMPGRPLDVPLFWQTSRIVGAALKPLTASVRRVAGAALATA